MKKIQMLVLAACVAAMLLAGCEAKDSGTADESKVTEEQTEKAEGQTSKEEKSDSSEDQTDSTEEKADSTENKSDSAEGNTAISLESCAGTYTADDSSSITIREDGSVEISLYRLTQIEGEVESVNGDILSILGTDAAGNPIRFEYHTTDKKLVVVQSTWDYLAAEESFIFE